MPRANPRPVTDVMVTPRARRRAPAPPPAPEPGPQKQLELEDFQEDDTPKPLAMVRRAPWPLRLAGGLFVLALILSASFEFVYAGKIYPGVSADGLNLSGLT